MCRPAPTGVVAAVLCSELCPTRLARDLTASSLPLGTSGSSHSCDERLNRGPTSRKASISRDGTKPRPLPPAPIPPPPRSPSPLGRAEERRPWGPRDSLPPSEGAGRGVPRGPHSFLRIAATLRIAGRATRGMPRAPDPGAKTNLRGVAAHAARWGGAGRTTGIGFLHSPSLQRAPLQPTRARSRGTQGSHPTTSGTSRGSRRRGNSVH